MSSRHQLYAWRALKEAGVKTIIDLRLTDHTDRLPALCKEYEMQYFHYPVDTSADAIARARKHNAMFPILIRRFENGQAKVEWQIHPDGKFYMDDDGFGMTNDNELTLFGSIDRTGKVVEKFVYKKSCNYLLL